MFQSFICSIAAAARVDVASHRQEESRGVAAVLCICSCPSSSSAGRTRTSTEHDMTTVIVLGQAY